MNHNPETAQAIAQLAALATFHNDDCVFKPELAGFAAGAAAKELLVNWSAALSDGSTDNLLADIDNVVEFLSAFRSRAAAILPGQNIGTGPRTLYNPGAELSEIHASLDGLHPAITPASIEKDCLARAMYMTEIACGMREPFAVD